MRLKKAREVIALLCLPLICLYASACGNGAAPEENEGKLSVVTTIFAPYDFVREIAKDNAEITMLLPPASESHSYEPTPQDIIRIQNCDVFIYVGGESDSWIKDVLSSIETGKIRIVTLMDCVEVVEKEIAEGMEEERGHGEEHGGEDSYDEHVWTSPRNAQMIVHKITDTLCDADSANAEAYRQRSAAYIDELKELDNTFKEVVNNAKRKTIVLGDRFPFRYLADAYGLEYFAAFPGCSQETEASSKTVAFLIDKIKEDNIPVVFHAELSNKDMAEMLSEATGAKVMLLHACHNITKDEFQNGASYLSLMEKNVSALKEALQ